MHHSKTKVLHLTKSSLILFACSVGFGKESELSEIEYFEKNIRPLLIDHCYECHSQNAKKLKGNLSLDSRDGWQIGGDSGPAIVPHHPEESLLIEAISHHNQDLKMPPKKRLSNEEILSFKEWIQMGAPDPRVGETPQRHREINLAEGRKFWAFQPPVLRPTPAVQDSTWPRNEIDYFILAELERRGINPASDTSSETLLRRVYYDLHGLPPSPEEIRRFSKNPTRQAFEAIVEDLLARPEFGERWGRHWLDVTRFAESSGGGRSMIFPHAWRFRDYVIDSLNQDKPYNQLIKEHLAGDLLSSDSIEQHNQQIIGSGYLVLGALNYELQDQELLRMEFVDEQIDSMGRTFLAMTLGCARCHDHKFDPIPTTDYYALAGIFQSTESMGVGSAASGVSSVATVDLKVLDTEEIEKVEGELSKTKSLISALKNDSKSKKTNPSIDPDSLPGTTLDSNQAIKTGIWKSSTHQGRWVGENYLHDDNRDKGASHLEFSVTLPKTQEYEVLLSYTAGDGRSTNTPITVHHEGGQSQIKLNQQMLPEIEGCFTSLGVFTFRSQQPAQIKISNEHTSGHVIVDAVNFSQPGALKKSLSSKDQPLENTQFNLEDLNKERTELEKRLQNLRPKAMAPREAEVTRDGHVLIRGEIRNQGELVKRGVLSVTSPRNTNFFIPEGSSGRLELAEWVASADNPLTARVMANRIWKHLLGKGIVPTTDNFGKTGKLPSHPHLLDYLALNFISHDWSIKSLVRQIVLSRTYQLASAPPLPQDPENLLLSRANRKRLEGEAIRDTALLLSGQLNRQRGGSTMGKVGQYDLNYQHNNQLRSVYSPWFRNSMIDLFEVFDAPNPNLVVGNRSSSNIPTQALFLMNSPFIRSQASDAAKSLLTSKTPITDAYLLFLGRPPSPSERATTENFLSTFPSNQTQEAWTQICQTLFSCVDFRYLD